ncbi:hypothetical protein COOONC_17496 [Cooperia oncophora]
MADWWSELARYGTRSDMLFSSGVRTTSTRVVTHWSKMAWWSNQQLGCATANCGQYYSVVCMYGPGGNDVGRNVYNIGRVGAECPNPVGDDGLCT